MRNLHLASEPRGRANLTGLKVPLPKRVQFELRPDSDHHAREIACVDVRSAGIRVEDRPVRKEIRPFNKLMERVL